MPLVKKERYLTLCGYTAGRCVCVTWGKLIVLLSVCMEWEMWSTQAARSWRCSCCYKTQGTYELKLLRKPALNPEPTPAGFREHHQKLRIGSYEHQLKIVNMVTVDRWGTCALSKKVSFIAAYTFPSIFTIICLHCIPSLLLSSCLSSCLYLLLCPLLPSSSPVSSGFPCHPPPQEPHFLLTAAVWSGLLAVFPSVMNTDLGLRGTGR